LLLLAIHELTDRFWLVPGGSLGTTPLQIVCAHV
jgi:hypothetical protein